MHEEVETTWLGVKRANQEVRELPVPARASAGSAGFDLRSNLPDFLLFPGAGEIVPTGWIWEIPAGHVGKIYIRSSWATKWNIVLMNQVGIVDSDYRGEVCVVLRNVGAETRTIRHGDRIAQMIIEPVRAPDLVECAELSATERGAGGFGSTGVGG